VVLAIDPHFSELQLSNRGPNLELSHLGAVAMMHNEKEAFSTNHGNPGMAEQSEFRPKKSQASASGFGFRFIFNMPFLVYRGQ
jgi:hypothetical protein